MEQALRHQQSDVLDDHYYFPKMNNQTSINGGLFMANKTARQRLISIQDDDSSINTSEFNDDESLKTFNI